MNGYNEIEILDSTRNGSLIQSGRICGRESAPIRIWVVDDNSTIRDLLGNLLNEEDGFECARQFSSSAAVLKALSTEAGPDVILLDVQMGAENGLDAIRPIKSLACNTHVLMLTTFGPPEVRERAFREGASDFLLKSWQFAELATHIRRAMEFGPVAGLLTAFLDRQVPAEKSAEAPQFQTARKAATPDRWFTSLRGWLKFSPS